ncbi:MAG: D-alanyl-D-alanine carboxypeptidase family protein, partial [Actinomycetota bacterium]
GFDDPRHYSTARDLAVIARAAMDNPVFRKIVATPTYILARPGRPAVELRNRNTLLGSFEGANGIKTGQTRQAGKALIASARRGEEERIAVVLDSPDPAAESAVLLEYGFDAFRRFQVARTGRPWGVVTFGNGSTATLVARRDLSLLLAVAAPDPRVTYLPREKAVEAAGLKVPVTLQCRAPACGTSNSSGRVAGALMYLFSPLLSLLR